MSKSGGMPLLFVPTPLGNLRDITQRALDALRDCDLLVAEDTRVARRLLAALGLPSKPLSSYREQNADAVTAEILARAYDGMVAVTTDAGMPGISDPGSGLLRAAREAGIPVEVLPGASAALGAAVLSGFDLRRFAFEGFTARTGSRRRAGFAKALAAGTPSIWFESPRRLRASLADLAAIAPEARLFLLREYTKLHEEQLLGTAAQILAQLAEPPRGEIAFVLEPTALTASEAAQSRFSAEATEAALAELLAQGIGAAQAARRLAAAGHGKRRELYARASRLAQREAPTPRR